MKRLWLFAICYNEERLLPFFLDHYRVWVDKFVFFDTGSTDGTLALLSQEPKVQVVNFQCPTVDDSLMANFSSETYKMARGEADWFIFVDCDEFLYPMNLVREAIEGDLLFRPSGYQMLSIDFPNRLLPLLSQVRHGIRDKVWDKPCLFPVDEEVIWRPGRHQANIMAPVSEDIKLLHYRYLGDDYFTARNMQKFQRMTPENIVAGRGYQVYPDHTKGKYSGQWYRDRLLDAPEVV